MRILLAGFVLTLRWLLVLLLPVLGFVVGLWLMPTMKPRWERTLDEDCKCAGITTIDDQPRVIVNNGETFYMGMPAYEILSLDLVTGKTDYTWKIDRSGKSKIELLPGTTHVVYLDDYLRNAIITVYDWRKSIDLGQGNVSDSLPRSKSLSYQSNVLIAEFLTADSSTISIWEFGEQNRVEPKKITLSERNLCDIQLSSNGDWAVLCQIILLPTGTIESQVALIDTRQGKMVQRLPDDINAVRWLPNENAFLALRHAMNSQSAHWQRYDRLDGIFVAAGPKIEVKSHGKVLSPGTNHYVVLGSKSSNHPIRFKLKEWLGRKSEALLDKCWPEMMTLDLYQASSGELLQSMTIPPAAMPTTRPVGSGFVHSNLPIVHPDPNGQGLVLQSGQQISYWQFQPHRQLFPYVGLVLGVAFAVLFAWRNLLRTSKRPQPA